MEEDAEQDIAIDPPYEQLGSDQQHGNKVVGLTILTTAVFLTGEMAGSGVLALPLAVVNSGYIGLVLILFCCLVSGYNGINLGRCWSILLERYPEYRDEHVRYPYPAIGLKAVGKPMQIIVSLCIELTLFGVSTVFVLIASQNIQDLLSQANVHFSFCFVLIILCACLTPFTWLGSPKDFWFIAIGASGATAIACVLLITGISIDSSTIAQQPKVTFHTLFLSFGAILFSFGGASTFPTIQHDMRRPADFPKAVTAAYIVLLLMYLPVSTLGYFFYGDSVSSNIIKSLPPGGLKITVEILITLHLIFAFVIALNPFSQQVEEKLNIPNKFCLKRCLLRTGIVICILFVAESIPHFGALLDLIGGSTVTFLTFVAPSVFYVCLCRQEGEWPKRKLALYEYVLNGEIVLVGILGGCASTYSAILEIVSPGTFVPPCYVNITAAEGH